MGQKQTGTLQVSVFLRGGAIFKAICLLLCCRDAEDVLEDKALGTFLIRLSDKTIGYILSYR